MALGGLRGPEVAWVALGGFGGLGWPEGAWVALGGLRWPGWLLVA